MSRSDDTGEDAPNTGVDAFVQALAGDGALDSFGTFTLDRKVAREKMQRFQLADPESYVLELVQAAVLKGATKIEFRIDVDDMRLRFDGRPFTRQEFETLYDALFSDGDGEGDSDSNADDREARRQLAIGLHAAQSLKLRFIVVASGTGEESAQLVLRPGKPDQLQTRDLASKNTYIHVKRRLAHFNLGRVQSIFGEGVPEEVILRERCKFARVSIELNDREISNGPDPATEPGIVHFTGPGLRGIAKQQSDDEKRSLHLVLHGVMVAERDLPTSNEAPGGFVAIAESSALRKDLSGRDVVEDEAYHQVLAHAEQALDTATRIASLDVRRQDHRGPRRPQLEQCPCWDVVLTPTYHLLRVQTAAPGEVLMVCATGDLLIREGNQWQTVEVERARGHLTAGWMPGRSEMVLADEEPAILVRKGTGWRRILTASIRQRASPRASQAKEQDKPPGPKLLFAAFDLGASKKAKEAARIEGALVHAIWATSPRSIWAVGANGHIFHGHHWRWRRHISRTTSTLHGVWAQSDELVIAVGRDSTVLHYDGTGWQRSSGAGCKGWWNAVWGSGPENVVAVGSVTGDHGNPIWAATRFNGSGWAHMQLPDLLHRGEDPRTLKPQRLRAIWGSSSRDVFAVGTRGTILHHDGTQWEHMDSGTEQNLLSVWGTGPDDVYAVGQGFARLHYDGQRWSPIPPPLTEARLSLAEMRERVGDHQVIMHLPGPQNLLSRLTRVAGTQSAVCIRSDLPDSELEALRLALNLARLRQA